MDVVEDRQQQSANEDDAKDVERDDARWNMTLSKEDQETSSHRRQCARERGGAEVSSNKAGDDSDGVDQRENHEQVCALEACDHVRPPYGQRDQPANQPKDAYGCA